MASLSTPQTSTAVSSFGGALSVCAVRPDFPEVFAALSPHGAEGPHLSLCSRACEEGRWGLQGGGDSAGWARLSLRQLGVQTLRLPVCKASVTVQQDRVWLPLLDAGSLCPDAALVGLQSCPEEGGVCCPCSSPAEGYFLN